MADAPFKIWTRCPVCRSKYQVTAEAVSHHARCKRCGTSFRVEEYNPHPTEDDILRWLSEGSEESEYEHYPRVISGTQRQVTATPVPVTARSTAVVQKVGGRPH